ncbi:MAG TPA: hypothetical protein VGD69_01000 [Herpetosiphonaceae bacterium]
MSDQLPYIIRQAATCPQFRLQLVANPDAVIGEYALGQEDLAVLTEALNLFTQRQTSNQEHERRAGWDGGPSFTGAAIS